MEQPKKKRNAWIIAVLIVLLLAPCTVGAQSANPADAILGEWIAPDKDGKFNIYKSGGKYYGKVIWMKDAYDNNGKLKLDVKNPNPALRSQPIVGSDSFLAFTYNTGEQKWEGKVYDCRTGDTYTAFIKLSNKYVMEVHGYIMFSWLGKSVYFTRY